MASLGGLDVLLFTGVKARACGSSGTVFYDKRNVAYKVDARSPLMILWWRRDVDVFVKLYRVVLVNEMALVALSMAVSLLSKSWLGV
ncbi:hypothetical protein PC117_g25185 [Phytophthora cactorum]|uniref:Uncharacterized protein n=1 Tax=Phytophthora cactorum TaxID=29920 RepID=A0A8T1APT9_9STRA|nr:hypothetical protein PC117_g25185 [Phytophthora cactorum]